MSKESLEEVTQKFIDAETERRAEYDADSAASDDDGPNGLTFADDDKIEAMEKRVAELEIKAKLFDRLYKWYWTPDNETVTVGDDLLAIMDEYRQIEKEGKH